MIILFSHDRILTFFGPWIRANRPKSYIARTLGWEQYPHGRWGDSHNPSYGALTDYQVIKLSLSFQSQCFALLECICMVFVDFS